MDVLLSFYIEGELSSALKVQVEEHMKSCATCRAKFDIIKTMISDLKNSLDDNKKTTKDENMEASLSSPQYKAFKNDLSAYIDNELSSDENIKIKKFTINNAIARKDLEDSYNIRKLMSESFKKTKAEARQDYSKNVLRQMELEEDINFGIHPLVKLLMVLTVTVLALTSIVLMSLRV